jgi:RNA recognition motif. (a.k.a. RRM, RBD, or RNP domain)
MAGDDGQVRADDGKRQSDSGPADSDDDDTASKIDHARAAVGHDPTSYTAHLHLVKLLRIEDLVRAREARTAFADAFPLPQHVWLEWLEDEVRIAASAAERARIVESVVPRALADYVSEDTAVFCIELQGDRVARGELGLDDFQEWFEDHFVASDDSAPHRPLSLAGHVYTNGVSVWRCFRKVLQQADATVEAQTQALAAQLARPLRGNRDERDNVLLPNVMSQPEWKRRIVDTFELESVLEVFEGKLVDAGSSREDHSGDRPELLLLQYSAYAMSEELRTPSAALVLWERCVSECFLNPNAWSAFADYARRRLSTEGVIHVLRRAVRNVPWYLPAWTRLLSECSELGPAECTAVARDVVDRATRYVLQSQDVGSAEQLSTLLVALCQQEDLLELRQTATSYNVKGSTAWANVQALAASLEKHESQAVTAMEEIVESLGSQGLWWIRYAELLSDDDSARAVYRRAIAAVGSPEDVAAVSHSWYAFESKRTRPGHCSNLTSALTITHNRLQSFVNSTHAANRVESDRPSRKRPPPPLTKPRRKKAVPITLKGAEAEPTKAVGPSSRPNKEAPSKPGAGSVAAAESYEPRIIYVNNLDFGVTPQKLLEVFSSAGSVVDVRIPRRKDGAAKGMAYVEFDDDAAAEAALAFDKMKISGREAWVRRSKPPKPKASGNIKRAAVGQSHGTDREGVSTGPAGGRTKSTAPSKLRPRISLNSSAVVADTRDSASAAAASDDPTDEKSSPKEEFLAQDDFRAFFLPKGR